MSNDCDSQKCHICETRKTRKSCLPEIVDAVEINCPKRHQFCSNCIQLYSRIDSKCPLCASEYTHFCTAESGETVNNEFTKHSHHKEFELSNEEKKMYMDYLETVSDLSSEEDNNVNDERNAENAERRIRNRIKQLKRLLHCDGVNCDSKDCMTGEHAEDCAEAIEEFHVGEYEWREAETNSSTETHCVHKILKREKTFEELLDECEQFVENAIKDEEQ